MIALYILPVLLAGHAVVCYWFLKWLRHIHIVFKKKWIIALIMVIYTYLILDMYVVVFIPHGKLEHILKLIGNYWYGISLYAIIMIVFAHLIREILKRSRFGHSKWFNDKRLLITNGFIFIAILTGIIVGGHINGRHIQVNDYYIETRAGESKLDQLNVVLLADLHMGHSVDAPMIEDMVDKVNSCNPDIILIAGDLFDNDYEAIQQPERIKAALCKLKSRYGIYAVWGNHDIEETIIGGFTFPSEHAKESDIRMDEMLADCGIVLLRDEAICASDSFYVYGRPDLARPGRGILVRKTPEEYMALMDKDLPVIVLDHEPKYLEEQARAGVDIYMAGHTHNGQFFPLNLTSKLSFDNPWGIKKYGDMTSVVTSGVGMYGPPIRIGTVSEVANIHISFIQ